MLKAWARQVNVRAEGTLFFLQQLEVMHKHFQADYKDAYMYTGPE